MDKEEAYEHVFNDPSSKGPFYPSSRSGVIKDLSVEDCDRTKEVCEFWVKKEYKRKYEEPMDFSIEDSDKYVYERQMPQQFTESQYRLVEEAREAECGSCEGTGSYCSECRDTGKVSCKVCCNGYRSRKCSNCGGDGKVEVLSADLDGKYVQCGECDGDGVKKEVHTECDSSGSIKCKECLGGNKDVECSSCNGEGEVTKIEATSVSYDVRTNSSSHVPEEIKSEDHYYIDNPRDRHWETVESQTFDNLNEAEEGEDEPNSDLLMPVPSGEKVKIRYKREEIEYKKIDLEVRARSIKGSYEDDTLNHRVWVHEESSRSVNKIGVTKSSIPASAISALGNYIFLGIWGCTIIALLLLLPLMFVSDYIYTLPDVVIGGYFAIVWLALNVFIAWTSITEARYSFSL